jgi:hypothetical protein
MGVRPFLPLPALMLKSRCPSVWHGRGTCYRSPAAVGWAGVAVPIRNLLRAESGVFGPEELKDIAAAFEATREHLGLTDRIDPATMMLAKLTIELAKQGQFTAASLRDRVASASWDSLVLVTRTGLIAFSTDR